MVIDAQATPLMAREVIRRIRGVTAKPIAFSGGLGSAKRDLEMWKAIA